MDARSNNEEDRYLVVIGGATATGKTAMSIRLARQYGTGVLSADSRQIYREMTIGTAKPAPEELSAVPHHFINHISVTDEYSAGAFAREARKLLGQLFEKDRIVLCTGGTGFYIKALCKGLDDFPMVPREVAGRISRLYERDGIEPLQTMLLQKDPVYSSTSDTKNPQRLIRALSVIEHTGRPFSEFLKGRRANNPFRCLYIQLDTDTDTLYRRINERVDEMIRNGLVEEARSLLPHRDKRALMTVGYRELFRHFDGEIGLEETIELIKRNTRRYAKRQRTWFRNQGEWRVFEPDDFEGIVEYIDKNVEW